MYNATTLYQQKELEYPSPLIRARVTIAFFLKEFVEDFKQNTSMISLFSV